MVPEFTQKQLTQVDRICFRLKAEREARGISVSQMAEKTKLRPYYIEALETCNFDALPAGQAYRKQFIKTYLKALDIPSSPYLLQYQTEECEQCQTQALHLTRTKKIHFQNLPSLLRIASLSFGALLMIGYLGIQVKHIVEPPQLALYNPPDGYVTTDSALYVQGSTAKEVALSINGKDITNTGSGEFKERLDLSPGVNTITISAHRKYGKATTIVRNVVLKSTSSLSLR